jgi:hypothetical protein
MDDFCFCDVAVNRHEAGVAGVGGGARSNDWLLMTS